MGWAFMAIAVFNIMGNLCVTASFMLLESLQSCVQSREEKRLLKLTNKRIDALQFIVDSKIQDVEHLKAEIRCHKDIIAMKKWWPHYKWLKGNKVKID